MVSQTEIIIWKIVHNFSELFQKLKIIGDKNTTKIAQIKCANNTYRKWLTTF